MARTKTPARAPHAARTAADTASAPASAPVAPAAADSPAAAVLAALSAEPAGAAVAVIAARAGISTAAARQALPAHEKAGNATRPGALPDLVEEHLRKFLGTAFTPHQVAKVLTCSAGAVANALDKLVSLGVAQMVTDKPRTYRLVPAPAPEAVGEPGTSAETAASAA